MGREPRLDLQYLTRQKVGFDANGCGHPLRLRISAQPVEYLCADPVVVATRAGLQGGQRGSRQHLPDLRRLRQARQLHRNLCHWLSAV